MAKPRKNQTLNLEGAEELDAALKKVGGSAGGLVLRDAAEAGASIIAEEAQRLAPRKTGALADGITAVLRRMQQGRAIFDIGYGRRQWYGRLVEKGTSKMPAQPFLRPAFDAKGEEAAKAVEDALREALQDVLS